MVAAEVTTVAFETKNPPKRVKAHEVKHFTHRIQNHMKKGTTKHVTTTLRNNPAATLCNWQDISPHFSQADLQYTLDKRAQTKMAYKVTPKLIRINLPLVILM